MTSVVPGAQEVLDEVALGELMMLDAQRPGFLGRVVTVFLRDLAVKQQALRTALAGGDVAEAERVAHSLKGDSLTLGAVQVTKLCGAIEQACRQGALDDARTLALPLEDAAREASAALKARL